MSQVGFDGIVSAIQHEIRAVLETFCFTGYTAMSEALIDPLGVIAVIYIAFLGFAFIFSWCELSMGEVIKSAILMGLIYTAVKNWGFVSEYGYHFVCMATSTIGDSLLQGPLAKTHFHTLTTGLQTTLDEFTKLGSLIFNQGGFENIGPYFAGMIVWLFAYVMVGLGLFEIILSEILIAILFVILPLIALFCFFKSTRGIFDRWLGLVIGAGLLQLLVKAILALTVQLAMWWLGTDVAGKAMNIGEAGTLPIILLGIICIGLIIKASTLAYTIGGGYFTFSGSSLFGRTAGSLFGGVAGTFKTAASSIQKTANITVAASKMARLRQSAREGEK